MSLTPVTLEIHRELGDPTVVAIALTTLATRTSSSCARNPGSASFVSRSVSRCVSRTVIDCVSPAIVVGAAALGRQPERPRVLLPPGPLRL